MNRWLARYRQSKEPYFALTAVHIPNLSHQLHTSALAQCETVQRHQHEEAVGEIVVLVPGD